LRESKRRGTADLEELRRKKARMLAENQNRAAPGPARAQ